MPAAGRPQGIAPTMLRSRLSSQINLALGGAMTLHYTFYLILQQSPSEAKKEKKKLRGTPPSPRQWALPPAPPIYEWISDESIDR